jgi:putative sterol carrier protein
VATRAAPPHDITPVDFFTRWIPESVQFDPERRALLAGTVARIVFHLEGEGGGPFTLSIEHERVTGSVGGAPDADLYVRLDVMTWRALNAGAVAPPEAVLRRRLRLQGDLRLGLKLHGILG